MKNKTRGFSFLTFMMVFAVIYLTVSASCNIAKLISYNNKLSSLKLSHIEATITKQNLEKEINNYTSESILRNDLKYAEGNEIELNLIEEPSDDNKSTQSKKNEVLQINLTQQKRGK